MNVDVWDFSPMYAEIPIIGAPYHEAETLIDFVSRKKEISGSLPVNFQNEILLSFSIVSILILAIKQFSYLHD